MTEYLIHCTFPRHSNLRLRKRKTPRNVLISLEFPVTLGVSFTSFLARGNLTHSKALDKLGNIAAETLLRRQLFPSLAARETMLWKQILLLGNKKMFLPLGQKHFCFPDTNFASATYVSQFFPSWKSFVGSFLQTLFFGGVTQNP